MSAENKETKRYPGESDEAHPDVFNKIPLNQPSDKKPGQLTPEQLKLFFTQVYIC